MEIQHYFFWSSVSLAIFYLFYLVFLRRETFFVLNRIYLLTALCLSVVIPLLDFPSYVVLPEIGLMVEVRNNVMAIGVEKETDWLLIVYWMGVLFSGYLLMVKLCRVKEQIKVPEKDSAFSFWKTKVIGKDLVDFVVIDAHEEVHVRQFHTLDILLVELFGVFFWFNPFVYCYRYSLKSIHEYLADQHAVRFAESRKHYAQLLFLQNFKVGGAMMNTFNHPSLLKARIKMLQRNRSNAFHLLKYFAFAPLLMVVMMLCSFDTSDFDRNGGEKNDRAARFPGGFEAFSKYLVMSAHKVSTQDGKVQVSFIVASDGKITDAKIKQSLDDASDSEALRIITSSPKWQPALRKGKKVRSAYQIGVNFKSSKVKKN
ncbi:M56 family metallopeptidase [Chryseobacterium herbae]|uniref:M56 family metallopeptidase n=1 Tax=Chryseobacterium herbae TaxID=2976476 RepID=A0ABT2IXW0_9FLAO|nr:M56 family metallopeptidase [Chryseobacterium sp. pc1-10]MCT2563662.1 M56 family metallopeptidase [Chryseobacterium sp. pc1-10]